MALRIEQKHVFFNLLIVITGVWSQSNSQFAFVNDKVPPKGTTLNGRNLLPGEQILSFKSWPHLEGRKNETDRVASLENVSIHLDTYIETKNLLQTWHCNSLLTEELFIKDRN